MYIALIKDNMIVWVAATKAYKKDIEMILEVQHQFSRGVVIHSGGHGNTKGQGPGELGLGKADFIQEDG